MKRRIAFLLAVLMCGSLLLSAVSPAAMASDDPAILEQAMNKAQAALDAAKQAAEEQGVEINFDHSQEAIADGGPTPEERAQLNEAGPVDPHPPADGKEDTVCHRKPGLSFFRNDGSLQGR